MHNEDDDLIFIEDSKKRKREDTKKDKIQLKKKKEVSIGVEKQAFYGKKINLDFYALDIEEIRITFKERYIQINNPITEGYKKQTKNGKTVIVKTVKNSDVSRIPQGTETWLNNRIGYQGASRAFKMCGGSTFYACKIMGATCYANKDDSIDSFIETIFKVEKSPPDELLSYKFAWGRRESNSIYKILKMFPDFKFYETGSIHVDPNELEVHYDGKHQDKTKPPKYSFEMMITPDLIGIPINPKKYKGTMYENGFCVEIKSGFPYYYSKKYENYCYSKKKHLPDKVFPDYVLQKQLQMWAKKMTLSVLFYDTPESGSRLFWTQYNSKYLRCALNVMEYGLRKFNPEMKGWGKYEDIGDNYKPEETFTELKNQMSFADKTNPFHDLQKYDQFLRKTKELSNESNELGRTQTVHMNEIEFTDYNSFAKKRKGYYFLE